MLKTSIDRNALLAAGFRPKCYEEQEGVYLVKKTRTGEMPYAGEHVVDNDLIHGDMEAVTELTPGDQVQLYIADADYLVGPYPLCSEEAQALLQDAIAVGN